MTIKYPERKMMQHDSSLDYPKFCRAVSLAWGKGHPDIPLIALGSKLFDNNKPVITYHIQRRKPADETPKPRVLESIIDETITVNLSGEEVTDVTEVQTEYQKFLNEIVFTIHVPIEEGGGEVADLICEEFERFMQEHTKLFMKLGASNLSYLMRFHDDNLVKEMSQNTIKRFIAYTLYTQTVTQTNSPVLRQLEVEIRSTLDGYETMTLVQNHTYPYQSIHKIVIETESEAEIPAPSIVIE